MFLLPSRAKWTTEEGAAYRGGRWLEEHENDDKKDKTEMQKVLIRTI